MDDILEITCFLAAVFDRLGIPYLISGSLASSLYGIPRATQDVDIVADMRAGDVQRLVDAIGRDFYLDADAMREAVTRHASFNVIHLRSYFKADIFVTGKDEASERQMARRQRISLGGPTPCEIAVASPEDVILQKLRCFALGDRVSERQWLDAQGVFRVMSTRLDLVYLRDSAARMNLSGLLSRAGAEAGIDIT